MPNRFLPLRSGTDMDQLLAILNKNFGELDGESITKVFSVSRNNPGFIQGQLPGNLGYGFLMYTPDNKVAIACYINSSGRPELKIAKDGYDALTATDAQLIFNSQQNVFKIVGTDIFSITKNNGDQTALQAIPHGLSIIPSFEAYIDDGGLRRNLPYTGLTLPALTINKYVNAYVDGTNIYVSITAEAAGTLTYTGRYYLRQETAD